MGRKSSLYMTVAEKRDRDKNRYEEMEIDLLGKAEADELTLKHDLDKQRRGMKQRLKKRLLKREVTIARHSAQAIEIEKDEEDSDYENSDSPRLQKGSRKSQSNRASRLEKYLDTDLEDDQEESEDALTSALSDRLFEERQGENALAIAEKQAKRRNRQRIESKLRHNRVLKRYKKAAAFMKTLTKKTENEVKRIQEGEEEEEEEEEENGISGAYDANLGEKAGEDSSRDRTRWTFRRSHFP